MFGESFVVWLGIFAVLAFLATIPVHFHLKGMANSPGTRQASSPAPNRPTALRPCPQCGHQMTADAAFCDNCGVPMMLWELKLAREVSAEASSGGGSHPVPIISQDVCIGCSACVSACEASVLEIVAGKSTVTNLGACTGVALCVEVCPTGACQLTCAGGAARKVEVPQIGADFETNVPGIYAVGELGGMGLIKNAVNEGQLLIEALKAKHSPREGVVDFIIVGAGPAGLSASLAAKAAGYQSIILEQGTVADTIRRFPNKKIVMAEPVKVPMYGSLWISDAPKETLLSVWSTIIESAGIEVNEGEQVTAITRADEGFFDVQTQKGRHVGQRVILAIGKRGTPRRLEVPGAELPKVMYSLADAAQYTGSRILVVGGGDSAAEAALGLSNQEGNVVTMSYRKPEFSRMKERNKSALTEAISGGRIRFLPSSQVVEVKTGEVVLRTETASDEVLPNDHVFALIGGTSPNAFLQKIGIHIVTKEVSMQEQKVPA